MVALGQFLCHKRSRSKVEVPPCRTGAVFFCTFIAVQSAREGSHHLSLGLPHTTEYGRVQPDFSSALHLFCSSTSFLGVIKPAAQQGGCSDMRDRCLKYRWNP